MKKVSDPGAALPPTCMDKVKLFGHSTGFDTCPGAYKWLKARVELRTIKYPLSGATRQWLRAECPECGKWLNFDTKSGKNSIELTEEKL